VGGKLLGEPLGLHFVAVVNSGAFLLCQQHAQPRVCLGHVGTAGSQQDWPQASAATLLHTSKAVSTIAADPAVDVLCRAVLCCAAGRLGVHSGQGEVLLSTLQSGKHFWQQQRSFRTSSSSSSRLGLRLQQTNCVQGP
jgi:hypothetical protein